MTNNAHSTDFAELRRSCSELSESTRRLRETIGDSADRSLTIELRGAAHNLKVAEGFVNQVEDLIRLAGQVLEPRNDVA